MSVFEENENKDEKENLINEEENIELDDNEKQQKEEEHLQIISPFNKITLTKRNFMSKKKN